jgi:hypothetical protein
MSDNESSHTLDEAIEQAQRNEVLVYPITVSREVPSGFFSPGLEDRQRYVVKQLATKTGGFGFLSVLGKDIGNTLDRIAELLTSSYVVESSLPESGGKKKGHEIKIRCTRKDVKILFRKRYFPPSE